MARWKLFYLGFFAFCGTLSFLRIVAQSVENQRRQLEHQRWYEEEVKQRNEDRIIDVAPVVVPE